MAICGDTCSISIGTSPVVEGHRFTINSNAPLIDVTPMLL